MKKKIILILFILLLSKKVYALSYGGCNFSDVARMKQLSTNVNITYNYRIVNNEALFDVTLNNLTNEIYVSDNYFSRDYYNFQNGELTIYGVKSKSITFEFKSNRGECKGILLGTKYETFPIYNKYYTNDVCSDMKGFSYCNKWVQKEYTLAEIKEAIKKYKESQVIDDEPTKVIYDKTFLEKLLDFYLEYYIIILSSIIIVGLTVIISYNKKTQFKL